MNFEPCDYCKLRQEYFPEDSGLCFKCMVRRMNMKRPAKYRNLRSTAPKVPIDPSQIMTNEEVAKLLGTDGLH